jgi:hypothetical protein
LIAWEKDDQPAPEDVLVIPNIRYLKKAQKGYEVTHSKEEAAKNKDGYDMIDPDWESEVDAMYLRAVEVATEAVRSQQDAEPPKLDPVEMPSEQPEKTTDTNKVDAGGQEIDVSEINTNMPF